MLHVTAILIYYLIVILCPSLSHARPILQLAPRQDPPPPPPVKTVPSSPVLFTQKPLLQILAPNVTLFAALDTPKSLINTSSSVTTTTTTNPHSTDEPAAPIDDNNDDTVPDPQSSNDAPLLLPTSRLSLTPNQIYHVNESLFYGAGGSEPLTGILIEWTLGCDIGDSFPLYPPTERPWIAFISSAKLSKPRLKKELSKTKRDVDEYMNNEHVGGVDNEEGDNYADDNDDEYDEEEEDTCTVSMLIAIIQAISDSVTGVIMYHDADGHVTFPELRAQTEKAVQNVYLSAHPPTPAAPTETAAALTKRLDGITKEQFMAKLATPGMSPYLLENPVPVLHSTTNEPWTATATAASATTTTSAPVTSVSMLGVLAMGDPILVTILKSRAEANPNGAVIAQLKFANHAFGPNVGLTPPVPMVPPVSDTERPEADRSLGLFFWVILGSVVLIVGVWVGFGVVEARSLARRRQQIALDNARLKTVDQKVLDTYKIKTFREDDILYTDDEDEDDNPHPYALTNRNGAGTNGNGGDRAYDRNSLSNQRQNRGMEEKQDAMKAMDSSSGYCQETRRVYARADLSTLKYDTLGHPHQNLPTFRRRSASFDETLYGGLDSIRASKICYDTVEDARQAALEAARSRDERCRSWAENKAMMCDYGGESESDYGYDQEDNYKSHAQEGWASLGVDTIKALDLSPTRSRANSPTSSSSSRRGSSSPSTHTATMTQKDLSAMPALPALPVPARTGGARIQPQPILRHKSRFMLPRKIETNMPTPLNGLNVLSSADIASPTVYGESSSAGPSTAGFLPPAGWGGERRRSSHATVAVPDNGAGGPQVEWTGPKSQKLGRSTLQTQWMGSETPVHQESIADDDNVEKYSDIDSGSGVGQRERPPPLIRPLRRMSAQVHRIQLENGAEVADSGKYTVKGHGDSDKANMINKCKERFSVIGVDLPDIYSPTSGEFSRLSLDADQWMQQQDMDEKHCHKVKNSERLRDDCYGSSLGSDDQDMRYHDKELTGATAATADTTGGVSSEGRKQRRRRYDPCAICLEEYEVGDQLRELPCKHFFHSECIDPWFKNVHSVCPVCKRDYSEAGRMTVASRGRQRELAERERRQERPSRLTTLLAPLAAMPGGFSGAHLWYTPENHGHIGY
ncbi:E3 ubiquitin-protein ligase rnf13 [Podila epigama]|nr:E3 ubiquitin-protein ligase rnf13 [Podila epigama]